MEKIGIFLDLDGTLLNSKLKISSLDKKIINSIKDKYNIYIITGKSEINAINYYKELDLKTKLITSMGQYISNPSISSFKNEINSTDTEKLHVAYEDINKIFTVQNYLLESIKGICYIRKEDNNSHLFHLIKSKKSKFIMYDKSKKNTYAKNIVGSYFEVLKKPRKEMIKGIKKLNKKWKKIFYFSFWDTEGHLPVIQITPFHTGKKIAMKKIVEMDNISKTIAIGNGWRDRDMLFAADIGIAVNGARKDVSCKASYTSAFNNDESVVAEELISILNLDKTML